MDHQLLVGVMLADGALSADTLLRLLGRLHPAFVHFPIALLIVGAMVEVFRLARRRPKPSPTALTCVIIGAVGACVAAFSGWMNADYETHSAAASGTLFWHRWLGVTMAGLGVLVAILVLISKLAKGMAVQRAYAVLLLLCAGGVAFTGFLGGEMVYGSGYYLEVFRSPAPVTPGRDGAAAAKESFPPRLPPDGVVLSVDYYKQIQPIFDARCVECHGPSKAKGNLRLDEPGRLLRTGTYEVFVIVGDPDHSELVRRIEMGPEDDDRMPPKGDRLTPDEIKSIRTWLSEGAYWLPRAGAAPAPPKGFAAPGVPDTHVVWTHEQVRAIEALRAAGARVEPMVLGGSALDINLSLLGDKATEEVLANLTPLDARIVVLNLARTPVTDAALPRLSTMSALETLHLEGTAITDQGLTSIQFLNKLAYLNVNQTKTTDFGAAILKSLPALKTLYAWQTGMTPDGVAPLVAAGVDVQLGDAPTGP